MMARTLLIVTVAFMALTFKTVNCGKRVCRTFQEDHKGKYEKCDMNFEKVGCYRDEDNDRALPCELLNERDVISKNYDGHRIDWKKFQEYIQGLACRCAAIAREKGHEIFGLQFYGECWSGEGDYKKLGIESRKTKCVDGNYKQCDDNNKDVCVGAQHTNYVYRLKYTHTCGNDE
ncbi:uncharacterized protein LOC110246994 [Exaiptasia diaphana]|uniref:Lysozyme n=1 Tax=Exaiptasia diaphana TaxID=2652724 RepID=A0A913XSI6_EXADI|nr:uncharacterized protein LOC110246994 [Exaiptasia diaphana]